jgi:DNA processing protein
VQDILEELRLDPGQDPTAAGMQAAAVDLPPAQAAVLAALGHDPVDLDLLAQRTQRSAGELTGLLLELELAQHVERLPGNRYQRLRR